MNGRRDFLKCLAGGVVAGFPTIVPSSALGRDGFVAPSDKVVMGAIGVGRQGSGDMRGFLMSPDVRMAAICDVNQATRERIAAVVNRRYNDTACATYNDFRELLGRSDIDAVVIATGERWHPLIASAAARAGKHMYCEKPLALSVANCKAVREAVNENGVSFQFGTQQRSTFYYRHAVELVRNGRIGEVKTIMVGSVRGPDDTLYGADQRAATGLRLRYVAGPSPWAPYSDMRVSIAAWLFISDYGLGCLDGAWGIHDIDIAQWVANADNTGPVEVEAQNATFYTDIRDVPHDYTVEHKYSSGIRLIHMDMATRAEAGARIQLPTFHGSDGDFRERRLDFRQPRRYRDPSRVSGHGEDRPQPDPGDPQRRSSPQPPGRYPVGTEDHLQHRSRGARPDGSPAGTHCFEPGTKAALGSRWRALRDDPEANKWLSRPMRSPWHL